MESISTFLAIAALVLWIPVILVLFILLPARRAVVAGAIAGWSLLPPIGIDLPGIPIYDKAAATTLGILLATLIFEPQRLVRFRPRWFDVPILLWCACPFVTSVLNELGAYDGLSAVFRQTIAWLLPYLVGRLYLTDADGMRDFAWGITIGGAILIPFCVFEIRMSPMFKQAVYGLGGFEGTRYGLFRPILFFVNSLELGLWMNTATLVAWWLWRTGQLKRVWRLPGGAVFAALLLTTIACRATGATALLLAGVGALWICWHGKKKWAVWVLLLVAPAYYCVRTTHLWSGSQAVDLARAVVGDTRADSFEFRLSNEELLIAKALQRPIFGWGGWGRNFVYDEWDNQFSIIDGMWVLALGSFGIVGLITWTISLLLPAILFLRRFPVSQWDRPQVAAAAAIAIVVDLALLYGLFNGTPNVIYIIAAGGLANFASARISRPATTALSGTLDLEQQAAQYRTLGRKLREQGRFVEAKNAWQCAIDLLTRQAAVRPDRLAVRQEWCDCANDLAWLMANSADPASEDAATAISLASKAIAAYPECGTYWNTLGAAYYRTQDFRAAVATLERACVFHNGGTAFDHFLLAMAYAQVGNCEHSRQSFALAARWLEQNCPSNVELLRLGNEARSVVLALSESVVETASPSEPTTRYSHQGPLGTQSTS
jgi:tetratricopeptide (TPR) repeat protein